MQSTLSSMFLRALVRPWAIIFWDNLKFSKLKNQKFSEDLTFSLRERCPNTEFFSGPYFPAFTPNTWKYGPEKTPYLDTFHTVFFATKSISMLHLLRLRKWMLDVAHLIIKVAAKVGYKKFLNLLFTPNGE